MNIYRKYKEGAFHMVEVSHNHKMYVRETYTGINFGWYEKPCNELKYIDQKQQDDLEVIYKKFKNEGKLKNKLERILNEK